MNYKLLAIFVLAALMIGVIATSTSYKAANADNPPKYSGPGNSGKVASNSFKQCEKQSPGNSPCR
jgi:hypothetical protein